MVVGQRVTVPITYMKESRCERCVLKFKKRRKLADEKMWFMLSLL